MATENTIITFPSSSTTSNALALRGFNVMQAQSASQWPAITKLTMPAAFTSTTLGIQGSNDNSTWVTLGDFRGDYTQASVVANTVIQLPEHVTRDWRYIRLTSSATQAAQRDITTEVTFGNVPPAR